MARTINVKFRGESAVFTYRPIDREVCLVPNESEAMEIVESMISENNKKSWSEKIA